VPSDSYVLGVVPTTSWATRTVSVPSTTSTSTVSWTLWFCPLNAIFHWLIRIAIRSPSSLL
jgi:hypothetical protein